MSTVRIKAPFPSVVETINSSKTIQVGEEILSLDGSGQEIYVAQVDQHISALNAYQIVLSDENVATRMKLLEDVAKQNQVAELALRLSYQDARTNLEAKIVDFIALSTSADKYYNAVYSLAKASADLSRFPIEVSFAKAQVSEALALANMERRHAIKKLDTRKLKAPVSGKLKLFVDLHSPVDRGHLVGEISTE